MKSSHIAIVASLVAVTLATMFIRVPLPTGGYFNFGDVAVIFGAFVVGSSMSERRWLAGAAVGGIGSAVADLLSGYAFFAPITLVAKGLEGAIAAVAVTKGVGTRAVLLATAGSFMVATYFVGEFLLPQMGLAAAVQELVPNIIQATGGVVGGSFLFAIYSMATPKKID